MRRFNVLDGLFVQNLMELNVQICIISRSSNKSVVHRVKALGIAYLYLGFKTN
jgi:3-deoxy-D-manno-octulosonate 8-phosphate phosphatase KdsC-like HAD superfamily phosphatase